MAKVIFKIFLPHFLKLQTLYASVQGNARARSGSGSVGEWGEGMGDFWDSIGNVNEENT